MQNKLEQFECIKGGNVGIERGSGCHGGLGRCPQPLGNFYDLSAKNSHFKRHLEKISNTFARRDLKELNSKFRKSFKKIKLHNFLSPPLLVNPKTNLKRLYICVEFLPFYSLLRCVNIDITCVSNCYCFAIINCWQQI